MRNIRVEPHQLRFERMLHGGDAPLAGDRDFARAQTGGAHVGDRGADHLARQPFGQVPFLSDGELEIFESGAGLLHLARKSEQLMPRDPVGEAQTLQWTIAALNSIEMVSVPWWFLEVTGAEDNHLTGWLGSRLDHMESVLKEREWLAADRFTVADLLMADVLRVPRVRSFGDRPATESYVTRITARPAFKKAHADQMAHFAAADESRSAAG